MEMTSIERVHAAARGLPVDRVPVFYWINAHTGCKLMARYRPSSRRRWNMLARFLWDRFERGGCANADEIWRFLPLIFDVHSFNLANVYALDLGADMILASYATPWKYARYSLRNRRLQMKDLYGVTRGMGGGIYPDMIDPVIKNVRDLEDYRLPDPHDRRLYATFRRYRRDHPNVSLCAEVWGVQDFTATSMFGMERFMFFLVDHPDEMATFLRRWTDYNIVVARESVRAGADIVFLEDDYGFDYSPLISMKMWETFTLPQLRRLVDAAHEAGALVALHSCGYQMPFLPYYVDLGIDMLHSFQPKAGNDFARAYDEFGDRLTFITGIDTQQGELMSAEDLRQGIVDNYRLGRSKGRLVLGTTHEIQYTMPNDNIDAIFRTVEEIQAGKHD